MSTVDLSQTLERGAPVFPGDPEFWMEQKKNMAEDGCTIWTVSGSLHTGTHVDFPMHMTADSRFAADFPLERFSGNGVLLDVRGEKKLRFQPSYEKKVGEGDMVLLYTGWEKQYGQASYYAEHPLISQDLAEFFALRKVKMVGMDLPSPDESPFPIHRYLLEREIFLLENLTNLESLLEAELFEVHAVPLKIRGEGSPVRAFARVFC